MSFEFSAFQGISGKYTVDHAVLPACSNTRGNEPHEINGRANKRVDHLALPLEPASTPRTHLKSKSVLDLGDHLDLHWHLTWQRVGTHRGPRVLSALAKDFADHVRAAVDNLVRGGRWDGCDGMRFDGDGMVMEWDRRRWDWMGWDKDGVWRDGIGIGKGYR